MLNDIKVLENIVSENTQELIKDFLTNTFGIPWFIKEDLGEGTIDNQKENWSSAPGFVNVFFNKLGINNPDLFNLSFPIIKNSLSKLKMNDMELKYARTFFQFPLTTHTGITNPHVDLTEPHLVVLYYVFDSDGDTIFFNKKHEKNNIRPSFEDYKIIKNVTPKQGTCVVFDGLNYHSNILPKLSKRCVINFNLVGYDKTN
jgi:hypothetical protein